MQEVCLDFVLQVSGRASQSCVVHCPALCVNAEGQQASEQGPPNKQNKKKVMVCIIMRLWISL